MTWSKGKYVFGEVKSDMGTLAAAILIPEYIPHVSIRNCFEEIYSAGFFHVGDDFKVNVYGRSEGLQVDSRPEDAKEIAKVLLIGPDYGRGEE